MKKLMMVIFAAMIAIALSAPAWAQATSPTPKAASVTKAEKKDAKARAKAQKKAKKNAKKNAATNKK
jgi:uncharacterized protein YxeA